MKRNKIVKTENMPSAVLDIYEDGSGRVTFFNNENHWHGEIFLTKEQIDFYYSEEQIWRQWFMCHFGLKNVNFPYRKLLVMRWRHILIHWYVNDVLEDYVEFNVYSKKYENPEGN